MPDASHDREHPGKNLLSITVVATRDEVACVGGHLLFVVAIHCHIRREVPVSNDICSRFKVAGVAKDAISDPAIDLELHGGKERKVTGIAGAPDEGLRLFQLFERCCHETRHPMPCGLGRAWPAKWLWQG